MQREIAGPQTAMAAASAGPGHDARPRLSAPAPARWRDLDDGDYGDDGDDDEAEEEEDAPTQADYTSATFAFR